MLLLLLSLGIDSAEAHRPHSVARAYTRSFDFTESGEAWAITDPHDVSQLMYSSDFGEHWDYEYSPATDDSLIDAAHSEAGLFLLGADGTVWHKDLDGNWSDHEVAPGAMAREFDLLGDDLLVATTDGIYVADVGDLDNFQQGSITREVVSVHSAPDGSGAIVAIDVLGGLWRAPSIDEPFGRMKNLPGGRTPLSIGETMGVIVVGTDNQFLATTDNGDSWSECGKAEVMLGNDYVHSMVELTANAGGGFIAASAREGVFRSTDGCLSWQRFDTGAWVPFGGIGNAVDPQEGVVYVDLEGDYGAMATFSGIYNSLDGGATWREVKLLPGDFSRSIAIAPEFPDDARIFTGGYGGGAFWTDDGGLTWDGSATGMSGPYTYDILPDYDVATSGHIYYSGSTWPHESWDDGATFASVDNIPMERVRNYKMRGERVWAIGEDDTGGLVGRLAYSDDSGASWIEPTAIYDAWDGAVPRDLLTEPMDGTMTHMAVVDMPAGVLLSDDDGESWEWAWVGARETSAGGALWPAGEATRLIFASATDGIIYSDDRGESWNSPDVAPEGRPRIIDQADDGTLLVVNRAGQVYRSTDGGENWEESGEPFAPAPYALSIAPDFAEHGTAVVSTTGGTFWTADHAESWSQLPRFSRFESGTYHIDCIAGADFKGAEHDHCGTYEDPTEGFIGGYLLQAGDILEFTFSGTSFSILGMRAGDGLVAVYSNGELLAEIEPEGGDVTIDTDGAGWKDIEIIAAGVTGDGIHVDAIEVYGEGVPMPIPGLIVDSGDTGDTSDTGGDTGGGDGTCGGCQSSGGGGGDSKRAWFALGAFAVAVIRFRRRSKVKDM